MTALVVAGALCAIAVPFVLYPLLLWLRACLAEAPIVTRDWQPSVDLVICAHDEADSIGAKLENALALDYPKDRLAIRVASDGSTDATVEIARRFEPRGVQVLDLPRGGKAAALCAAVAASSGEILAFSDANSMWQPDALKALVRPLADARVGGVAGDQRYAKRGEGPDADRADGERAYWRFDRRLKRWQSRAGNAISATGAIYAVRRSLFEPPPPDATDDFMISTGVIARGYRLVFSSDAVAVEPPADATAGEFRRKVRIITRGLRAVAYRRALLDPRRFGLYSVELLVHKLWRRLVFIPLGVLVLATPACWAEGGWLAGLALGMTAGLLAGIAGLVSPALGRFRPIRLAAYGLMVNAACAVAAFDAARGRRVSLWESQRATLGASGRPS